MIEPLQPGGFEYRDLERNTFNFRIMKIYICCTLTLEANRRTRCRSP